MKEKKHIRIVTPSRNFDLLSHSQLEEVKSYLSDIVELSFSKNCFNMHRSISNINDDINEAMDDTSVDYVMASIGGFSCNSLLTHINWEKWTKPMIGFSDITVLLNAAFKKTKKIHYLGPMLISFAQPEPLRKQVRDQLMLALNENSYYLEKSEIWSDDEWWLNNNKRTHKKTEFTIIKPGSAKGILLGGNLSSLQLLIGTEYLPDFHNSILFIEEDKDETYSKIKRMLDHLLTVNILNNVKGILIGRMPSNYDSPIKFFEEYFKDFEIPIIYGLDLGHTDPHYTIPIGSEITIQDDSKIFVKKNS